MQTTIEIVLDQELPAVFATELYRQKRDLVWQRVVYAYAGTNVSVYSAA